MSEVVRRKFRFAWLLLSSLAWVVAIYVASHTSENPDILGRFSWRYFAFLMVVLTLAVSISVGNSERFLKEIFARRRDLFLFFTSLFVAFGLAEACFRIIDPLGISYYEEGTRYHLDKIADAELIYRHRPSWRSTYQGVEVKLNEYGLRDAPIHVKEESEYRILVLGDSLTFGWGVAQNEIFPFRLQQILAPKLGRPVRVINAGVGSYDTVQECTYLKNMGLAFEPDLILLNFVSNDIEINEGPFDPWSARSFRGKSPPQVFKLLLKKSWIYRLTYHAYLYGWFTEPPNSYVFVKGSSGWKASMESLKKIVDISKKHKIPLIIFYFRWQPTPFESALLEDVRKTVAPIPVADMSPWFADKKLQDFFNSQVDTHPNSQGHRVIAENIAYYLFDRNLFAGIMRGNFPS